MADVANDFAVAFIYSIIDEEASQALQFCHDECHDIIDIYRHGQNVVGFFLLSQYESCKQFCLGHGFCDSLWSIVHRMSHLNIS